MKDNTTISRSFTIDGEALRSRPNQTFDGLGFISANNSSRLLLDYKADHPQIYRRLLEYVFGKAGLQISHIKIEMGADIDSSSGTEPAVKRTADEPADVTRGAGYQLAADALRINPQISVDLLYWGEPAWVAGAKDVYDARARWYLDTISALYDTYGIRLSYLTVNQNEREIDLAWVKYLVRRLRSEQAARYDYRTIRIVCGEAVGTWEIADAMLADAELMGMIDVISSHYTSFTTENVKKLQREYGKQVWFSEGSAPMNRAELTKHHDGTGTGISEINGALDIAARIVHAAAEGMTMYEYQPAISAYYDGVTYYPKQLITANEPWAGGYSLDVGFYQAMHISYFIEKGWCFAEGACFGDGKPGGDGHAIVDAVCTCLSAVSPQKDALSVVLVNPSGRSVRYRIAVRNLTLKTERFHRYESTGVDGMLQAGGTESLGEDGTMELTLKPYSLLTLTTLEKALPDFLPGKSHEDATRFPLPYRDDFSYDAVWLRQRGAAPKYTTDQGGAFEVAQVGGRAVLQQQITYQNKPKDWASTANPTTNLGDDRWADYLVCVEVLFAQEHTASMEAHENYVGAGLRYNLADNGESGYWMKLCESGAWVLYKNKAALASGEIAAFDAALPHTIKVQALGTLITAAVDGEVCACLLDEENPVASGRAALYSDYQKNCFTSIAIEALPEGKPYTSRLDDQDAALRYSAGSNLDDGNGWFHNTMSTFRNYNRTCSTGGVGDAFSFDFTGNQLYLLGTAASESTAASDVTAPSEATASDATAASASGSASDSAKDAARLAVTLDGARSELTCTSGGSRMAFAKLQGLSDQAHTVRVEVLSGTICLDAVEYR